MPDLGLRFRPKLLDCLGRYSRADLLSDLGAGATVGVVALSLAMALGIASGSTPAAGIWTAVVAGFLISALGGSKVQVGGPTAAFIPVVVAVSAQHGPANLVICTLMAGVMLFVMGAARLGTLIKFIPFPVTAGFTAGIAVVIFSTQVKDFLGLRMAGNPGEFVERLRAVAEHLGTISWPSVGVAAGSLALIRLWPHRWGRHLPASIVAVVLGTLASALFGIPVETIGGRYGSDAIPQSLPSIGLPALEWSTLTQLVRPAFTIALLAAIESLLCAAVADGMIDDRHDSNQELMAQGVANVGSALCGGLPATGAIARTATNIRSGARTPVAGMVHAVALLAMVLLAAPLALHIPLPVLSAVLVNVALGMGEWHNFSRVTRWPRSDSSVFLGTFVLTVLFDITVAVEVGMILAAFLFIKRVSETTQILQGQERRFDEAPSDAMEGKSIPSGVLVYSVLGAFLFGAADKLESAVRRSDADLTVLILKMRQVLAMDATGLQALEELAHRLRRHGKHLILAGPHSQPLMAMSRSGFVEWLGEENLCEHLDDALVRARALLEAAPPADVPQHPPSD